MRILLFGNGKWACLTLRALLEAGHEIVGVVAETDAFDMREEGSYQRFASHGAYESLKEAARSLGIQTYQPADIHDPNFITSINQLQPELVICVSYHGIFKEPWLKMYTQRIINAHLAPLPYYRGRSPLNWAIINGETSTAVTVHFIDEGIDTGPIIKQDLIPINQDDRAIDVLLRALPVFPKIILESISLIETGQAFSRNVYPLQGSYFPKRTTEDGLINWQVETTWDIYNKIRALSHPYPGGFSYCKGKKLIFERSSIPGGCRRITPVGGVVIATTRDNGVQVTTIDGWLEIKTIRVCDDEVPAAEYLKVGNRFEVL